MIRRFIIVFGLFLFQLPGLWAQEDVRSRDSASMVFELGEVQVTGTRGNPFTPVIQLDEIDRLQQTDVASVLSYLPGVHFIHQGPRNDGMVSVRGFDLRQVPVYVDGVPVYVSYDGYTDLSRFLVADLSKISVTRGETSVLLGPNNLGGAINLVTRKPSSELEFDSEAGVFMDRSGWGGWRSSLNLGTRMNRFFVQLGAGAVQREPFALSARDEALSGEEPLDRDNSQFRDFRTSVKLGYLQPGGKDSYVLSYQYQDGSKGVPEYTGEDPGQRVRYWKFPGVVKQGVHFNGRTSLGRNAYLQTKLFYDDYFSDLRSYDDSTYSSQTFRSSFTSIYDDQTMGGSVILSTGSMGRHEFRSAFHVVHDHHSERNIHPQEEPWRYFRDITFSAGVEDRMVLSEKLHAVAGISVHYRFNLQADDFDPGTGSVTQFPDHQNWSPNLLTGLRYQFSDQHLAALNISRKTRFPTMKDRYSYRLGRSLPNPLLEPEASWNLDISYLYRRSENLQVRTAVFISRLRQTIQEVYGVDPGNSAVYQFRNTGDARFYGWELDADWKPLRTVESGLQYTFIRRENLTRPELWFTDVPVHRVYGFAEWKPFQRLRFRVSGIYNSERISTSEGTFAADPFFRMDAGFSLTLLEGFFLTGSVENIWDAAYSYVEGYPAPGRVFFLGLRLRIR